MYNMYYKTAQSLDYHAASLYGVYLILQLQLTISELPPALSTNNLPSMLLLALF